MSSTQISPMLAVSDARDMIEFYKAAFGAIENWRIDGGGHVVCGMSIDGAEFFLASANPPGTRSPRDVEGVTCRIELFVDDPHAVYERAVAAGATPGEVPKERAHPTVDGGTFRMIQGGVADPSGHTWLIGRFLRSDET
jgi:PhnB protein